MNYTVRIKIAAAILLFNVGMRLLPKSMSNKDFIVNCIAMNIIKDKSNDI